MEASYRTHHTAYPDVTVPIYVKTTCGTRCYNKRQICYICEKKISKMARHLQCMHKNETEVARVLSIYDKELQALELERLRLLGNFNHNLRVLKDRSGELIVARRPTTAKVAEDYVPCHYCYTFVETTEIWRHVKNCIFNDGPEDAVSDDEDNGDDATEGCSVVMKCRMLLAGAQRFSIASKEFSELKKIVIDRMRDGNERDVIEKDHLILTLGSVSLEKCGSSRRHNISTKMRQLARLVLQLRKSFPLISLDDCICGEKFDAVVRATRKICGQNKKKSMSGTSMLNTPSLGLQIGHSLAKVIQIKNGQAIRNGNKDKKDSAQEFKELFENEWTDKISSQALQTLKDRRYNREDLLPLTADIAKVTRLACERIEKHSALLKTEINKRNWTTLAKAIFLAVTIFNKRRGGEVARVHLSCYENRPNWQQIQNDEMTASLTKVERKLVQRFVELDFDIACVWICRYSYVPLTANIA